jgi:hypothetical protein
MTKTFTFKSSLVVAALLALPLANAAAISKADYSAGKTRIGAAYKADQAACDSFAANAKDVCVEEAKAVEVKALADAKMGKQIGEARSDAAADKRDADYKVAVEKCDVMAGDAKSACVASAKAQFGKG